jgi:hypothetical protein
MAQQPSNTFPTSFPLLSGRSVIGPEAWTILPKDRMTTPAAPAGAAPLAQQSGGVPLAGAVNVTSHLLGGMFGAVPVKSLPGPVAPDFTTQHILTHHATANYPNVSHYPPAHGTAVRPAHSRMY